jgi:hypothetical protein
MRQKWTGILHHHIDICRYYDVKNVYIVAALRPNGI